MSSISNEKFIDAELLGEILNLSQSKLSAIISKNNLDIFYNNITKRKEYSITQLNKIFDIENKFFTNFKDARPVQPLKNFKCIELFAGAGGIALGLEKAGLESVLLNEIDKYACETLKINRPSWNVINDDIKNIDFTAYKNIDFISGGFPCQSFSYAGKQKGFNDIRGTLFFEFARAIKECQPKVFMAENVKGLLDHDNGKTINIIKESIKELGYILIEPKILKAIFFNVPQKRERLFLVAIRQDLFHTSSFKWPKPFNKIYTLKDAFFKGNLYSTNVEVSIGSQYPQRKKEILSHVPQGGYWRDLPIDLQKEYMKKSFFLSGGKTGIARRISWNEPCLTLTCSPAQNQTERCHPEETRPLTVREYARVQTFPDDWRFYGSMSNQYKQIGNAVPVNLAYEMGKSIVSLLNKLAQ